jgi:hypothetical protein
MVEGEQQWRKYWEEQSEDYYRNEAWDPVAEEWKYRSFVSRSNGKGRKPRKNSRGIELAVNRQTGRSHLLKDIPTGGIDVIAEALLGHLMLDHSIHEEFLSRLRSQD